MLKNVLKDAPIGELKSGPSTQVLNAILNYSKSLEVKKVKKKNMLIHLN
jgi:hypothetical protein